jgi:hypothetical protein
LGREWFDVATPPRQNKTMDANPYRAPTDDESDELQQPSGRSLRRTVAVLLAIIGVFFAAAIPVSLSDVIGSSKPPFPMMLAFGFFASICWNMAYKRWQ